MSNLPVVLQIIDRRVDLDLVADLDVLAGDHRVGVDEIGDALQRGEIQLLLRRDIQVAQHLLQPALRHQTDARRRSDVGAQASPTSWTTASRDWRRPKRCSTG